MTGHDYLLVVDDSADDEAIPLPARVASLERGRKWLTGIATAALLASGASFWSAAKELYAYGEREGAAAILIGDHASEPASTSNWPEDRIFVARFSRG